MTSIDVQTSFSNDLNNTENKDIIDNTQIENNSNKKTKTTNNKFSTEKTKIRITKKKKNYFSKDFWPDKIITGDFCNGLQKGSLLGLPRMVQITQINNRMNKKMIENSWKYQNQKKPKPKKPSKLMQLIINQFYSEEVKK